uniref:Dirigent protein n=1 Tax=Quercus lobata TaxID=97700 RepID=A0A7N2MZB7_QUELO
MTRAVFCAMLDYSTTAAAGPEPKGDGWKTSEFQRREAVATVVIAEAMKAVFHPIREMPIVGGTGAFRLARGFVTAKTHVLNFTSGDAIIEYHVVAIHYWAPSL